MRSRLLAAIVIGALALMTPARAQEWIQLGPDQQGLLRPWESRWSKLPEVLRARLLENARIWSELDPAQRRRLEQRIARWDALPAAERARLRERYEAYRAMTDDERHGVQQQVERVAMLPPEERAALRARFDALSQAEQRRFLQGPNARDAADVGRRLFAFVPGDERAATWRMLRELTQGDRQRLRRLAPRLSPAQRDVLRRDLMTAPPERRSQLLAERLGD